MTDVQKIAFDTLKAGAPGLSDQTREVLAGIISRKVALSTAPGQADDKATLAAVAKAVFEGDTALAIRLAKQSKFSTTPARAEAQDEGAAGEIGAAIQRVEAVSLGGDVLDVYGAESFAHPTHTFRGDLRALLARARPSPTPAADADRVRIAVEDALAELRRIPSPLTDDGDVTCWSSSDDVAAAIHAAQTHLERAALKSTAAKEGGE